MAGVGRQVKVDCGKVWLGAAWDGGTGSYIVGRRVLSAVDEAVFRGDDRGPSEELPVERGEQRDRDRASKDGVGVILCYSAEVIELRRRAGEGEDCR